MLRRRLTKLFKAGLLDRFRPLATRGSFPWTYQLDKKGHRLLQNMEMIPRGKRFETQEVYDYRYVLHELHLNAWVIAWREHLGDTLETWTGETQIDPPPDLGRDNPPRVPLRTSLSAENLKDPTAKQLRPDDLIEVKRGDGTFHRYLIEYDRTRRVDKNFEKFRRYDSYLCWWGWGSAEFECNGAPAVLFVCQDQEHLERFLRAADSELTGHQWGPGKKTTPESFVGRDRISFVLEEDVYEGRCIAYKVPALPPRHGGDSEDREVRCVRIAGDQLR